MLSHRTLYLHGLSVADHVQSRRRSSGAAHHSAVSRQRLGTAADRDHAGPEAGDGAALRTHHRISPDSGRAGHGDVPGADHGQRAAERAGPRRVRFFEPEEHSHRRRSGVARTGRPHGARVPLPGAGRLRAHRDRAGGDIGAGQIAPCNYKDEADRLHHRPWPAGRCRRARFAWSTRKCRTCRATWKPSAKW